MHRRSAGITVALTILLALAGTALASYHTIAAKSTTETVRTVAPIEEGSKAPAQDPGGDASVENTTVALATYVCGDNMVNITVPEDISSGREDIIIVILAGTEEYKFRCKLSPDTSNVTKKPRVAPVGSIMEISEQGPPPTITGAVPLAAQEESGTVEIAEDAVSPPGQAATSQYSPSEYGEPVQQEGKVNISTVSTAQDTGQVERERLMITLIGGLLAGLLSLVAWRILVG